jgi:hypothetical protein
MLKLIFPLSKKIVLILSDKSPDFFDSIALANINILIHFINPKIYCFQKAEINLKLLLKIIIKDLNLLDQMHAGTFG